jgi:hypothetical protein
MGIAPKLFVIRLSIASAGVVPVGFAALRESVSMARHGYQRASFAATGWRYASPHCASRQKSSMLPKWPRATIQ